MSHGACCRRGFIKIFDSFTHRSTILNVGHIILSFRQVFVSICQNILSTVKWIMTYFSSRCQRVFLKDVTSHFASVSFEVSVNHRQWYCPILLSIVIDTRTLTSACENIPLFKYFVLHFSSHKEQCRRKYSGRRLRKRLSHGLQDTAKRSWMRLPRSRSLKYYFLLKFRSEKTITG